MYNTRLMKEKAKKDKIKLLLLPIVYFCNKWPYTDTINSNNLDGLNNLKSITWFWNMSTSKFESESNEER